MVRYKVVINTDSYKKRRCSKKNWEPGTMNDYMEAINGWHTTEHSIREVIWRLQMFQGQGFPVSEYDEGKGGLSERYKKWEAKKCNQVKYFDKLCGFERTQPVKGYGFTQGYFSISSVIEKLKNEGSVKIPFSYLYDIRQYYKNMDGCYMEITKI